MIRRGRYKFVHSPVDPDQLYDLSKDPDERVNLAASPNLAANPEHAQITREFRAEVAPLATPQPPRRRDRQPTPTPLRLPRRLRAGRFQPWDFQPIRDASRLYIRNDQELNDLEAMARFPRLD
jgi:choline-sulfatase